MEIGQRLRHLREEKDYSQGDIERRTGLLRCYVSRVENGHTIPSVDTLVKWAGFLEIPLYRLFTDETAKTANAAMKKIPLSSDGFGSEGKEAAYLRTLTKSLAKLNDRNRNVLLKFAATLTRVKNGREIKVGR